MTAELILERGVSHAGPALAKANLAYSPCVRHAILSGLLSGTHKSDLLSVLESNRYI